MTILNTAFKRKSNTMLNNGLFSWHTVGAMHETMKRLYAAAELLKQVTGQSAVARLLNASPQTVKNWEARGVSKQGMLDAEQLIGCRPSWVRTGDGEMAALPLSPDTTEVISLAYSKPASDDIEIRQFNTGGSMGDGVLLRDQPGVIQSWRVSHEWLQKNVKSHSGASNLCLVTGFGDSMRPMFEPGDPLIVDTGVKTVDFDGIYFFRVDGEGFIKRLQRIPGEGIRAISENKAYESWTIRPGMDFEVFGRVLKAWKSEDY